MWIAFTSSILTSQAVAPPSLSTELIKIIVTAAMAGLFGAVGAYIAGWLKLRELRKSFDFKIMELTKSFDEQREADRLKQQANLRDKFLSPLLFAANELADRLRALDMKLDDPADRKQMLDWFNEIDSRRTDKLSFERWCNDYGHFAVTTLFITANYFAYANRILTQAPFHEVDAQYSRSLAARLVGVRESLSFLDGVWRESQECVGRLLTKDDRVLSYYEFCVLLFDPSTFNWFFILLNFYRKLDLTKKPRLAAVLAALSDLQKFLD